MGVTIRVLHSILLLIQNTYHLISQHPIYHLVVSVPWSQVRP